jgi:PTS system, mannose/fructose/sorbose family, IIA component
MLKGETEMINLIVATHGKMSEETVNLTKMVLGESEQLEFVTFVPGEGPEDLIEKYNNIISKYDAEGTLFLVDLFGGSPYNAACRVVAETKNTDVITGVSVPMLLEVLDAREETSDVSELVQVAKNSGINGIKIFSELFRASDDSDEDLDELDL